jgi:hypothetical protein
MIAKEDMAQFIEDQHAKFQFHPLFLAAYGQAELPIGDGIPMGLTGKRTSSRQDQHPPFDWNVIDMQLSRLDLLGKGLLYHDIVQEFTASYDAIIRENSAETGGGRVLTRPLGSSVHLMSQLATNMSAASERGIKYRLRSDKMLSKLRVCMSTLCDELAKRNTLSPELDRKEIQKVKSHFAEVDRILRAKYTESSFKSGIEKMNHLF